MFKNQSEKDVWNTSSIPYSLSYNTFTGLSILQKEGLVFHSLGPNVCNGNIQSTYLKSYSGEIKEIWLGKTPNIPGVTPLMEETYYPWLLNNSPWAKAFNEKDYKLCKKYGFRIDTTLPHDYVASACVSIRWLTEKYDSWVQSRYPLYEKLLLEKVDPLWAFIMSNLYTVSNKNPMTMHFSMQSGHEMLPPNMSLNTLKNFVEGKYAASESFEKLKGYRSIGSTWGSSQEPYLKLLAKTWTGGSVEKQDHNVFRKPAKDGYPVLNFNQLLVVMKQLQEHVYEKQAAA